MVTSRDPGRVRWVTLIYRVPREPSSPRIAIWRRLKALGVAQLIDGVVALPEDARTREHLEWIADQVIDAGGTALLMHAETLSRSDEQALATAMAQARVEEYQRITRQAEEATGLAPRERARALKRLRRDLRVVRRRDYFPPTERDRAAAAVQALATGEAADPSVAVTAGDTADHPKVAP